MTTPTPRDYGLYDRAIERAEYVTQALRDAASDLAEVRKALDPHRQSVPPDSECQRAETDVEVIERLVSSAAESERMVDRATNVTDYWTDGFKRIMVEIGWPHGDGELCIPCILEWIRKHKDAESADAGILLGLRAAAILTADHDCGEKHDSCLDALRRKLKRLTPEAAERLVRADGSDNLPDDIKPLRGVRLTNTEEESLPPWWSPPFATRTLKQPTTTDVLVVSHDDDVHVESHVNPTILTATLAGPFPDGLWAECRITNVRRDAGIRVFIGEHEVHTLEQRAEHMMMPYALGWEPKMILGPTHDPAEVTVTVKASARRTGATFGSRDLRLSRSPIVSPRRDYTYTVTEVGGSDGPVDWSAPAPTPKIEVGQVWEDCDGRKAMVTRLPPPARPEYRFRFGPADGVFAAGPDTNTDYGIIFDGARNIVKANDCKLIAGPGAPWPKP